MYQLFDLSFYICSGNIKTKMMISKQLFIKTIEALQEQYNHDKQCADALGQMYNTEISGTYNTSYLSNAILELLRVHFPKDADGHCEIEHYAYCLNFGKLGEEYESPEELYFRLCSQGITSTAILGKNTTVSYSNGKGTLIGALSYPSIDPNFM